MKQLQEIAGEVGVPGKRIGEIAQAERRAELAQIGGIGPERGRIAPVGAGRDDEAVEPIVVRLTPQDGQEATFEPLVVLPEVDAGAIAGLQHHVVQRHVALAVGEARPDVIGALVDGREAHVLQHRHALGERDRCSQRIDDGVNAAGRGVRLAMKIDDHRLIGPEPLDARDVLERALGREGLRVSGRERRAVLGEQRAGVVPFTGNGVGQSVLPGAYDVDDLALELGDADLRRLSVIAADDELHPHERTLWEVGIERHDAAVVGVGQKRADALAHAGRVAVARRIHEHRHEAVEAIDARKHPHPRPRLQVEHPLGPVLQLLDADLEQLVAREGAENVEHRLGVMAVGRIAAGCEHLIDLVAQERDLAGRAHIGLGCKEADEAQLAFGAAVRPIGLHPDVVHVRPAVHAGNHVGLGDDEWCGLEEEAAHLWRHGDKLGAAA